MSREFWIVVVVITVSVLAIAIFGAAAIGYMFVAWLVIIALTWVLTQVLGVTLWVQEQRRPKQPQVVAPQAAAAPPFARQAIPEQVRHEVWRRDQGHCVDCGSRERLEYDHIIPVAQGGSNTARNIELRCERCNRSKGARV
ncbi:MAG: HNH endonuclease signature motif containing protein [Actinomycetota bacterium]